MKKIKLITVTTSIIALAYCLWGYAIAHDCGHNCSHQHEDMAIHQFQDNEGCCASLQHDTNANVPANKTQYQQPSNRAIENISFSIWINRDADGFYIKHDPSFYLPPPRLVLRI